MGTNEPLYGKVRWWSDPLIVHMLCNFLILAAALAGIASLLTHQELEAAMKITVEKHYRVLCYIGVLLLASILAEHWFDDLPRQRLMNQISATLITIGLLTFFGISTLVGLGAAF